MDKLQFIKNAKRGVIMKKFRIIFLSLLLLFCLMGQAFAELSSNRIALGIQLGAKFEDAKKVFGVPDRVTMEEIKSEANPLW